jgi:hypothetical protein
MPDECRHAEDLFDDPVRWLSVYRNCMRADGAVLVPKRWDGAEHAAAGQAEIAGAQPQKITPILTLP